MVAKDDVHLLDGLVAGLWYQEPDPEEHKEAEGSKEEICAELQLVQHVRRDLAHEELLGISAVADSLHILGAGKTHVHHVVTADVDADGLAAVARGK